MTCPINIYLLSRIHEEDSFHVIDQHLSQKDMSSKTRYHEMESLRFLADSLLQCGVTLRQMDGFFFGFIIPQIGKEFDLLRFTDTQCLNIELKSTSVGREQIHRQLQKNRYYLKHLGRELCLYTVVTETMTCYCLSEEDELKQVPIQTLAELVVQTADNLDAEIDDKFRAGRYLVSPMYTPDRFIQGEYFLTQAQEQIKKEMLLQINKISGTAFFHLTGKPGTGKTLLLYDLAKTLSKKEKTLIVHYGRISSGLVQIANAVAQLSIISVRDLPEELSASESYPYLLVDEAHRLSETQFSELYRYVQATGAKCICSSEGPQSVTISEKQRKLAVWIEALSANREFVLSEKLRANRELQSFISRMMNLKHHAQGVRVYRHVQLNYANTTAEAQELLRYYRDKGYIFINYGKSVYLVSPYEVYEADFDTDHVIGQEFDKVVMLMDRSFYYDEEQKLQGIPHPDPDYLYPNLFYQGITRVREELAVIVVQAPELFRKIVSIVKIETES